jgi:hypothetical protein
VAESVIKRKRSLGVLNEVITLWQFQHLQATWILQLCLLRIKRRPHKEKQKNFYS